MRETSGVFRLPARLRFGGGETQPLLLRAVAHKKPVDLPHIKAKAIKRARRLRHQFFAWLCAGGATDISRRLAWTLDSASDLQDHLRG